ncbi:pyridoxamine 5'-phosphate oxidase family protein [Streptosporangiaceae bacterium NEAU-GS5]|nr:pyridoxamine 5'-phosphate oxidase family protein [Streptosporangiaceae bacterium NEAU-GS5]
MSATASPGDLARRVAHHRDRLGLSRQELARRAGIAEGYVSDLEEQAWPIRAETLMAIASALQTTVDDLLGGAADRAPGQGPAMARPTLEVLSSEDCWKLIGSGGVGRVAFTGLRGQTVLPVNYRVHDGVVVFRTRRGGQMEEDLRTGMKDVDRGIAFEVDRIDEAVRGGWSVLLRGPAHLVTDDAFVPVSADDVQPWAGGERDLYIQITPHEITGRRIHAM